LKAYFAIYIFMLVIQVCYCASTTDLYH